MRRHQPIGDLYTLAMFSRCEFFQFPRTPALLRRVLCTDAIIGRHRQAISLIAPWVLFAEVAHGGILMCEGGYFEDCAVGESSKTTPPSPGPPPPVVP